MQRLLGVKATPTEVDPNALLSPNLPRGFQTVAGWWAMMETAALEWLPDPVATLFEEEERIVTEADALGIVWVWSTAPEVFVALGFPLVRAFPTTLLHQMYPLNP